MLLMLELHVDVHYHDVYTRQQQQQRRDIGGKGIGLHDDVQHMEEGDGLSS